ncbi:G-protein alpha subunit-domain-containing protein [Mycena latifolia]|nr:G-protein alpha subunit-domain-containing protein [Mycena latifolia]
MPRAAAPGDRAHYKLLIPSLRGPPAPGDLGGTAALTALLSRNRMRESPDLLESVINSRWFLRARVILFLNKIDVFKRKLPTIPLGRYFPEYVGGNPNDLQKTANAYPFPSLPIPGSSQPVTQATNTKNIRLVLATIKETILQNALKDSGIL